MIIFPALTAATPTLLARVRRALIIALCLVPLLAAAALAQGYNQQLPAGPLSGSDRVSIYRGPGTALTLAPLSSIWGGMPSLNLGCPAFELMEALASGSAECGQSVVLLDTLAELRAVTPPTGFLADTVVAHLAGIASVGDGLGGFFDWSATSSCADNGGLTCVKPTSESGNGRWLRSNEAPTGPLTESVTPAGYTASGAAALSPLASVHALNPTAPNEGVTAPACPGIANWAFLLNQGAYDVAVYGSIDGSGSGTVPAGKTLVLHCTSTGWVSEKTQVQAQYPLQALAIGGGTIIQPQTPLALLNYSNVFTGAFNQFNGTIQGNGVNSIQGFDAFIPAGSTMALGQNGLVGPINADGLLNIAATGGTFSRNIADANPAFVDTQANAGSTGDIHDFCNAGGCPTKILNSGAILAPGFATAMNLSATYLAKISGQEIDTTGSTAQQIQAWINVAGNALGTDGCVAIHFDETTPSNTATDSLYIQVAAGTTNGTTSGTVVFGLSQPATDSFFSPEIRICNTHASNSQFTTNTPTPGLTGNTPLLSTIDTTQPWTISINAAPGAIGDTVRLIHYDGVIRNGAGS